MNGTYFLCLGIGAGICTGLFAWRLRRMGMKATCALISLPVAVLLAAVMAKVGYFLLEFRDAYGSEGFSALLSTRPAEFSFVCGAAGVVLAVILGAKWSGCKPMTALDAFAPCGALMAAVARACEGLLDPMALVGMGDFVSSEALWFFPIAIENAMLYSWFYAVFMLEAALALICAAGSFAMSHGRSFAPGNVFLLTLVFLATPQIFSEQILSQCMMWGFVRIEQMLCAVIVFAVILYACLKCKKKARFAPALLTLLCAGVIIWIEFVLDNKPLFGLELSTTTCYALMILSLGFMAGLSVWAFRRLNQGK